MDAEGDAVKEVDTVAQPVGLPLPVAEAEAVAQAVAV
jgi:hypothetical protein